MIRTIWMFMLLVSASIGSCLAFTTSTVKRPTISLNVLSGFFKNPLEELRSPATDVKPVFMDKVATFDPTSEDDLITRAKALVASDLGILDGGLLLDDDFIWIGATSNGDVLGKVEYLAAGKYFELRTAFPDLDFRSHDYRLDLLDPMTVRLTARTVGNMRGPLRLRNDVLPPNGKQMVCPPEAISITFGQSGKVKKICSGFAMDRLVGNTGGLCGVMAAATIAGAPPSAFEVYPITTVLGRLFARPQRQLEEPKAYLAPFPETVMIQLAKGIVAAQMAALDPDLLSDSFTFCGALSGQIDKKRFLDNFAANLFGGAEPDMTHFRVDPYDPYRVWVDVRSYGQFEDGDVFETPPQSMSFTFDDDGFCIRITGEAVMDPSIGNTGGLGGVEGINYAAGSPSPSIATRSLPQILGRLRKKVLEPWTKIGVDDYVLEGRPPVLIQTNEGRVRTPLDRLRTLPSLKTPPAPPPRPPTPKEVLAAKQADAARKSAEALRLRSEARLAANAEREAAKEARDIAAQKARAAQQAAVVAATTGRTPPPLFGRPSMPWSVARNPQQRTSTTVAPAKNKKAPSKQEVVAKTRKEVAVVASKRNAEEAKTSKLKAQQAEKEKKAVVAANKRKAEDSKELKRQVQKVEMVKKAAVPAAAAASKNKVEESKDAKRQSQQAEKEKNGQFRLRGDAKVMKIPVATAPGKQSIKVAPSFSIKEPKTKPAPPSKPPPLTAFGKARSSQVSKTIALPKKEGTSPGSAKVPMQRFVAPKGVPSLMRWKKNRDGSVTGLITGSDQFDENERITTSPILKGTIAPGNAVETKSGSKYFLT